jgi:hypothetical protein
MSSKTIFQLTNYSSSLQVQNNDLFYITDVANSETKQINASALAGYVLLTGSSFIRTGSYSGLFYGTASYANNGLSSSYASTSSYALNSPGAGIAGGANIGTGSNLFGVYDSVSGTSLNFKSLRGGSNITITEDSTNHVLQIAYNGGTGGVTNPGGSNTAVQYNDGGAFAGNGNFTYNTTTGQLTIIPSVTTNPGLIGTSSFAISCSRAITSSYAVSASNAYSSSYAISSSYALSSSYATTAGVALSLASGTGVKKISNSVNASDITWSDTGDGATYHQTGFYITVTPNSISSTYIIDLNVPVYWYLGGYSSLFGTNLGVTYILKRSISGGGTTTLASFSTYNIIIDGNAKWGYPRNTAASRLDISKKWVDSPSTTNAVTYELWAVSDSIYGGSLIVKQNATIVATEY